MKKVLVENQMWRERFFRYAPLILWIGVVLFASTGNGSMQQTSRFIRPLLEFLFPTAPEETLQSYHAYIRKCAHFVEYAILAFWACRAFINSSKPFLQKHGFLISFLIVLCVATIDETNQSFNPARTGSPWDVLLDCAGGATIILIFSLTRNFLRKNRAI